jgi:VacB/RNase II family 3'-5' exoribonuclease
MAEPSIPSSQHGRLARIARRAMLERGLEPDVPPEAVRQAQSLRSDVGEGVRDLRSLPWSSIDNESSRDLDQLEVLAAASTQSVTVLVAIADVDSLVRKGSPIDLHARANTLSVYTPAEVFPMLPEALSTDRTSLNPDEDRLAIVIEIDVDHTGQITRDDAYTAVVRNHAKLAYPAVGPWLDGQRPPPPGVEAVHGLDEQLRAQDRVARQLRSRSHEQGALDFERTDLQFILDGDDVRELRTQVPDRARELIESLMVAVNGVTARLLADRGFPSLRRVVRSPKRWPRIVEVAARYGQQLPDQPDAPALQQFLEARRREAPDEFANLSLTIIKLLGRGEYVAARMFDGSPGHFALASEHYTHATAPNRRFADLVTQRLLKAALEGGPPPYTLEELEALAAHCTRQEDAANKVERQVRKAAAALYLSSHIGETFDAIVTGASAKGTWVRLRRPPIEGRLDSGYQGVDVGDALRVRLVRTDPERGFIDFDRV